MPDEHEREREERHVERDDYRGREHGWGEGSERMHRFIAVCVVGMLVIFVAVVVWVLVA